MTSDDAPQTAAGRVAPEGGVEPLVEMPDEIAETAGRVAPEGSVRLQRFLARAGVASRRSAEAIIAAGRVTVNGEVRAELGTKVCPARDVVAVDGGVVGVPARAATIMLHKPAGYVTTMIDPQGRPCVADLVPVDRFPGLYPLGRLDRDTTGLLLFSADGDLGNALLHPRRCVEKGYLALVEGDPSERALERLRCGIELSDGMTLPAGVEALSDEDARRARKAMGLGRPGASGASRSGRAAHGARGSRMRGVRIVRVTIREGRKREVRRMFEAIGHPVLSLHRDRFGPLSLGGLPCGAWRTLSAGEARVLAETAGIG